MDDWKIPIFRALQTTQFASPMGRIYRPRQARKSAWTTYVEIFDGARDHHQLAQSALSLYDRSIGHFLPDDHDFVVAACGILICKWEDEHDSCDCYRFHELFAEAFNLHPDDLLRTERRVLRALNYTIFSL
jgi:hypothetical protein